MPKVSVIIPVYNVEQYLPKCLDSVINQTLTDIEIICVNDCSTDGSLAILKDYAQRDNRIKLIDLPQNQGVSIARNTAIDYAGGEYIAFLDPDDWWELDLAEHSFNKIKEFNSDIAVFCSNLCDGDKITVNNEQLTYLSEALKQTDANVFRSNIVHYAWDKLYKTELIKKNNIRFVKQIVQAEDVIFSLECISYKPKVIYLPKCLYNYRINREGSAMADYSNRVTNHINAFKAMLDCKFYINSNNKYKQFCINTLLGGIVYFYILSSQKNFSIKDFQELRKLVPYMRLKIPAELLNNINQYMILNNLTSANLASGVSCLKTKV